MTRLWRTIGCRCIAAADVRRPSPQHRCRAAAAGGIRPSSRARYRVDRSAPCSGHARLSHRCLWRTAIRFPVFLDVTFRLVKSWWFLPAPSRARYASGLLGGFRLLPPKLIEVHADPLIALTLQRRFPTVPVGPDIARRPRREPAVPRTGPAGPPPWSAIVRRNDLAMAARPSPRWHRRAPAHCRSWSRPPSNVMNLPRSPKRAGQRRWRFWRGAAHG